MSLIAISFKLFYFNSKMGFNIKPKLFFIFIWIQARYCVRRKEEEFRNIISTLNLNLLTNRNI